MNKISLPRILLISLSYTSLTATSLPPALDSTNVGPIPAMHAQYSPADDDFDYHDFGDDNNLNNLSPIVTPVTKKRKKNACKKAKKKKGKVRKTKQIRVTEKEINDTVASLQYLFQNRVKLVNEIIETQKGRFKLEDHFHNTTIDEFVREYALKQEQAPSGVALKKRVKNALHCGNRVLWEFWELVLKEINEKEKIEQRKINIIIAILRKDKVRCTRENRAPKGRLVAARLTRHTSFICSLKKAFPKKRKIIKELWKQYVDTNKAITKKAKKEKKRDTTDVKEKKREQPH